MTTTSSPSHAASTPQPFSPAATESPGAFEAFLCYFELGPNRTLKKTAEILAVSENTVEEWSSRHAWRQRIREYRAKLIADRLAASPIAANAPGASPLAHDPLLHSMLNELGNRLLQTSQKLFQHQLVNNAEKIDMGQVLRMMQLGEKLLSSARTIGSTEAQPDRSFTTNQTTQASGL